MEADAQLDKPLIPRVNTPDPHATPTQETRADLGQERCTPTFPLWPSFFFGVVAGRKKTLGHGLFRGRGFFFLSNTDLHTGATAG